MSDGDIILDIDPGAVPVPTPRELSANQRRFERLKKSTVGKLARKIFGRRAARRGAARAGASAARKAAMRARGAASAGRAAAGAGRVARLATINPVTAVAAALAAVAVVGARISSGKSFDQIGESLQEVFLGGADDEARAKMEVRNRFMSNDNLAEVAGRAGGVTSQMKKLYEFEYERQLLVEKGKGAIRRELGVNQTADMVILRLWTAITEGFKAAGGMNKVKDLIFSYKSSNGITPPGAR